VRAHGYLDFAMILYYSWKILEQHPFVGRGVASRFAWLLIDEFQDTTDIQIAIFGALQLFLHTRFFLVGDQNQSIMRFAGARPELAEQFSDQINAHRNIALTGNFRCGPAIVTTAARLIPTVPGMQSAGDAAQFPAQVNYVNVGRPIDAITDHFLPSLQNAGIPLGKAAILAPWWTHLIPVARALREFDVPVFGPGARPYRRRRLLAGLAEQLGACAEAGNYLGLPGVERALFRLIGDLTGSSRYDIFSYQGRRVALGLIYLARELAERHPGGVAWLRAIALSAGSYLEREEWLPGAAKQPLIDSAEEMLSDMRSNKVEDPAPFGDRRLPIAQDFLPRRYPTLASAFRRCLPSAAGHGDQCLRLGRSATLHGPRAGFDCRCRDAGTICRDQITGWIPTCSDV
jgi:DNA helicase-2/ATP-dependent DNA helicase PcrA